MKIDKPLPELNATTPVAPHSHERAAAAKAPAPAAPPADSVSLSERSRDLQRVGKSLAAEPAFDAAKVEAVKAAIADGTFKVDPGKIADGLIADVELSLSRKPQ